MSRSTISPEVQKIINASINAAVKKAVEAIQTRNEEIIASQRNYFKETEKLLSSLPALKLSLADYDEDIKNDCLVASNGKSKDIVRYSSCGGNGQAAEEDMHISKLASVERTRKQVQRIERALEAVESDQYYDIIPMKYWDRLKNEEIAEKLDCEIRTIQRNKNRIVNKLKIILFGADALNM